MTVHLWRVASDTPGWTADDLSGKGAASKGARWNHPGELATYAATSVSLSLKICTGRSTRPAAR